jgi:hypothetical protein
VTDDDATPTIDPREVAPYVERARRSTQSAATAAAVCALEVLTLVVPVDAIDPLTERTATDCVRRHLTDLVETHARADRQEIARLRVAILRYLRDDDREALRAAAYAIAGSE